MGKRRVEQDVVDSDAIPRALAAQGNVATIVRLRRDSKHAFTTRMPVLPCGASRMAAIPALGKALRIYNKWYVLCCYCASVICMKPHLHFYHAHPCCLRCDHAACGVEADCATSSGVSTKKLCRFCGRVANADGVGTSWKMIKAPLDVAAANEKLPPPLRHVWYCPVHYKSWATAAHQVLETRVILTHIATGAKPIFDDVAAHAAVASSFPSSSADPSRRARKRKLSLGRGAL